MLRQRLAALTIILSPTCLFRAGVAGEPGEPAVPPPAIEEAEREKNSSPTRGLVKEHVAKAAIDKMLAAYDLKPRPLPPIPDDPPPHEGAMINLPVVVEPPDMMIVEVLEALPGRPISGERLVRPDGTISLGFYGE